MNEFNGIPCEFNRYMRSTDLFMMMLRGRKTLIAFSITALQYKLRGIRWHDDADHCSTWSDGCRCDLGDES